jgi:hypothetical protein
MKTLSTLLLLGTITAIIIGGIFAVSPVFAENQTTSPDQSNNSAEPVAPITGNAAAQAAPAEPNELVSASELDAPVAVALTFSLEKDTASAEAVQQAEALAEANAEVSTETVASFDTFVASVSTGDANQITGIFVDGLLAYNVSGQNGNPSYVNENENEVTKFALAAEYGTQAFLAHNYLAGGAFFTLTEGQIVTLVYGDGSSADFRIQTTRRFQALSPDSTQSSFVDLESGEKLSNSELFHTVYNSDNSVVLQTCIAQDNVSTWGRLFVIAVPLS